MNELLTLLALLGAGVWLLRPKVTGSATWRAVGTPLASIIGSGFLVSTPILSNLYGGWAVLAMAALLLVAYLVGAAVRENILHVEPLLAQQDGGGLIGSLERLSHLVLAFAYFVSVAYYLVLFASFLLKPMGLHDLILVKAVVTLVLTVIGGIGLWRGFRAVEGMEIYVVSAKLAVIAGMMMGLFLYDVGLTVAPEGGSLLPVGHFDPASLPVLLGLLILVQGFETSRFLGNRYSPELRVRTMKIAQLLSAAIYLCFFLLMTPLFSKGTTGGDVAAVVDMLGPVSFLLPLLVLAGALASQSSAAIADTLGAGGLVYNIAGSRIRMRHIYPLICVVAGVITWETHIYSLITFASRCFAAYYGMQCLVAAISAAKRGRQARASGFALLALFCVAIIVFGTPVEGG
jgi:hypothetical protein